MAEALGHKWGQIIGDMVEATVHDILHDVAAKHGLYLDYKKKRAARSGTLVAWVDKYGNSHNLDYVFERGGSETKKGAPAAFIEIAWRRYTKHSKNKAQEIEGALAPIAETYKNHHPFLGVVLAGEFTAPAVDQLRSKRFGVLHISYEAIIKAFEAVEIDAAFNENTPESAFRAKIEQWEELDDADHLKLKQTLYESQASAIAVFVEAIDRSFSRQIEHVFVTVLHGAKKTLESVQDAIDFISSYPEDQPTGEPPMKYEVNIRYNNGDEVRGSFGNKEEAVQFLKLFSA